MQWFVVRGFAVVGSTSALVQLSASAAHQPAQYNMVALRLAALLAFSAFLAQVQTISEELFLVGGCFVAHGPLNKKIV